MLIGFPSVYDFYALKVMLLENALTSLKNVITLWHFGWFLAVITSLALNVQIILFCFPDDCNTSDTLESWFKASFTTSSPDVMLLIIFINFYRAGVGYFIMLLARLL